MKHLRQTFCRHQQIRNVEPIEDAHIENVARDEILDEMVVDAHVENVAGPEIGQAMIVEDQELVGPGLEQKIDQFVGMVKVECMALISELCGQMNVNRKTAFYILNECKRIFYDMYADFLNENFVDQYPDPEMKNHHLLLNNGFNANFDALCTEYRLLKSLQGHNVYREPKIVILQSEMQVARAEDNLVMKQVRENISVPDVVFQLKVRRRGIKHDSGR